MSLNIFGYYSPDLPSTSIPRVNNAPPIITRPEPSNLYQGPPVVSVPENSVSNPPPENAELFENGGGEGVVGSTALFFKNFFSGEYGFYGTFIFGIIICVYVIIFMMIPAFIAYKDIINDALYSDAGYKWIYQFVYIFTAFFFGPIFYLYKLVKSSNF